MNDKLIIFITTDRQIYVKEFINDKNILVANFFSLLSKKWYISERADIIESNDIYIENIDSNELINITYLGEKSLDDVGVKNGSLIYISRNKKSFNRDKLKQNQNRIILYGCPMAKSVEEAINDAEKYCDDDSYITTGSITKK